MSKSKAHKREEAKVIAILTADWHLQHKPPVWRSNEPDWYLAMCRPLDEISALQQEHKCPVLVAGDIFDRWNAPAELINFAIKNIPEAVYAIPGQHDLPNHNIQELHRSAFTSLMLTERIAYTSFRWDRDWLEGIHLHPHPYGVSLLPCTCSNVKSPKVAIVHDYIWKGKNKYPNAPEEKCITYRANKMINGRYLGYDVIVYGDNHKGFTTKIGKTTIWNCGTLMRRTVDEEDYKPKLGLLYSDKHIEYHYLDTSKDEHLTKEDAEKYATIEEIDTALFAKELRKLGATALDFVETMKQFWLSDGTKKAVQNIILKAMERKDE